jgi:hypothetical protein
MINIVTARCPWERIRLHLGRMFALQAPALGYHPGKADVLLVWYFLMLLVMSA